MQNKGLESDGKNPPRLRPALAREGSHGNYSCASWKTEVEALGLDNAKANERLDSALQSGRTPC